VFREETHKQPSIGEVKTIGPKKVVQPTSAEVLREGATEIVDLFRYSKQEGVPKGKEKCAIGATLSNCSEVLGGETMECAEKA